MVHMFVCVCGYMVCMCGVYIYTFCVMWVEVRGHPQLLTLLSTKLKEALSGLLLCSVNSMLVQLPGVFLLHLPPFHRRAGYRHAPLCPALRWALARHRTEAIRLVHQELLCTEASPESVDQVFFNCLFHPLLTSSRKVTAFSANTSLKD